MNNSVLRALAVLDVLVGASAPQRLRDICVATGIPKSTALSILAALVEKRFAELDAGGYRLGVRAFEVGAAYLRGVSPSAAVHPELLRLRGGPRATEVAGPVIAAARRASERLGFRDLVAR